MIEGKLSNLIVDQHEEILKKEKIYEVPRYLQMTRNHANFRQLQSMLIRKLKYLDKTH